MPATIQHQNLLIIGSGFSLHNMKAFLSPDNGRDKAMNDAFETWLIETCCTEDRDEAVRNQLLINWDMTPPAVIFGRGNTFSIVATSQRRSFQNVSQTMPHSCSLKSEKNFLRVWLPYSGAIISIAITVRKNSTGP